jgi:Streptomyces sporulation and cell division protein, SsgA
MSSTISAELELRLVVSQQTIVPMAASLSYSSEDPYAMRIAFNDGEDEAVEWTFARDLLSTGIESCEGMGDVRVWPSASSWGGVAGNVVNIELRAPSGRAHFEAPVEEISEFVRRTYEIVPAGKESDHVNVESELTELLRRGK